VQLAVEGVDARPLNAILLLPKRHGGFGDFGQPLEVRECGRLGTSKSLGVMMHCA
jgi:hypothetical protein